MTRAAVLDQPALWDLLATQSEPKPAPAPIKKTRRFHVLDLPTPGKVFCNPRCIVCRRHEDNGLCRPCSVVCGRPLHSTPVEVCLTTTHVTARPAGDRLIAVTCPWCSRTHWHSAAVASPYRISGCGRPYIVHLTAPEATA
ncbi:hypothetical protein AB0J28_00530 [Streptosporangium canum]|uniref:hypothetical protein n=1 Tax=Streptosporangium canum TaxID=324952 RepID=UPI0034423AF7